MIDSEGAARDTAPMKGEAPAQRRPRDSSGSTRRATYSCLKCASQLKQGVTVYVTGPIISYADCAPIGVNHKYCINAQLADGDPMSGEVEVKSE